MLALGYEGDRAYAIWDRLAPKKTIVLISRPSFRSCWEGRVEKFNERLLSKLPLNSVRYMSAIDPFGRFSST